MNTYTEQRPWGQFEQFCHNQQCTVKIITVQPNQALSLQYHHHRDEFWRVIHGEGIFTIGDRQIHGKKGDEFFIPKKTNHRIATTTSILEVMEVAFGIFDENDIVRLEDKYQRTTKT